MVTQNCSLSGLQESPTMLETMNRKIRKKPICIGTGLVALDVVMNGNPQIPKKIFAGGSCGNVLTILSFLKWETYPIARLKKNIASVKLLADLEYWNVNRSLISLTDDGSTPIIIHRIKKDKNGNSIHRFEFRNPENGKWFPSYKAILVNQVDYIIEQSPIPSVFYFDRVTRAAIEFAKFYKKNGAIVYFEPSSITSLKLFEECLKIADIVKFSSERIKNYASLNEIQRAPLEIETFGKEGLRYRFDHNLRMKEWKFVASYKNPYVVDAAGAGDWFSAGLISKIAVKGLRGFNHCQEDFVLEAIRYGQALGSLNCFFDGARGLMYVLSKTRLQTLVKKIQDNKMPVALIFKTDEPCLDKNFDINSLY